MHKRISTIGVLLVPAIFVALVGHSATSAAQTPPATPPAPQAYNPGIADLMNLIVQPRHTKLWFAGKEGNWALAEYEIKELRTAFANATRARPVVRNRPLGEAVETFMSAPFRAVEDAIRDHDVTKFTEAYTGVNAGCNACHVSFSQAFVVIKSPEQPAYPDQDFRPPK